MKKEKTSVSYGEKVAQAFDLPAGSLSTAPRIEMWGTGSIRIENHKGLLKFERECIIVATKGTTITISGFDLDLSVMTKTDLVIVGKIMSLGFESEGTENA